MANNANDYFSAVNKVIAASNDAEEGFRGAANAVNNPKLRSLFEEYSSQRAIFAAQLRTAVEAVGGDPKDSSGILGSLHSGWIVLKGALTGHSEYQILEEAERGEDFSTSCYRDALEALPPAAIRSILERQYEQVQAAHDRIKQLRDRAGEHKSAVA